MADDSNRLQKLRQMLEKDPTDTFLLYGIAMEYRKVDAPAEALDYLARVVEADPLYAAAYHQAAQIHESTGNVESAKKAYRKGIAAAAKKGDAHAQGEMEAALAMIE